MIYHIHTQKELMFLSAKKIQQLVMRLDTVIALLTEVGRNALMAKSDIEEAFCIIHPYTLMHHYKQ